MLLAFVYFWKCDSVVWDDNHSSVLKVIPLFKIFCKELHISENDKVVFENQLPDRRDLLQWIQNISYWFYIDDDEEEDIFELLRLLEEEDDISPLIRLCTLFKKRWDQRVIELAPAVWEKEENTWQTSSGRTNGGKNYQFGDITRTALRKLMNLIQKNQNKTRGRGGRVRWRVR